MTFKSTMKNSQASYFTKESWIKMVLKSFTFVVQLIVILFVAYSECTFEEVYRWKQMQFDQLKDSKV